jgi:RNAse (barnase) inhibitor barstar
MKIGLGFDKYPEAYDYIATFSDVSGIEGEFVIKRHLENENPVDYCKLTLFGCNINKEEFLKKFNKESELYDAAVYIYILSNNDEILTSDYVSNVEISELSQDTNHKLNVTLNGWLYPSSKGFYEIIKKRLVNGIDNFGAWKNLPSEKVQGWLDAALRLGTYGDDVSNKIVTIDSKDMDCKDKFYCALGEAVNGIGGYFGRNLHALDDCFNGGFGIEGNFTLEWINHKLYKQKFPEYFKDITDVFLENNKSLVLQ